MSIVDETCATTLSPKFNHKHVYSFCHTVFNQLRARKPMGQLQTEIDTQNALRRSLNWVQLTGIGLGGIIGE